MKLIDLIGRYNYIAKLLTDWNLIENNRYPTKQYLGQIIYIKLDRIFKTSPIHEKVNIFKRYGYIFNESQNQIASDPKYAIKGKIYLSSGKIILIQSNKSFYKSEILKYMHSQEVPYSLKLNEINVFN